jgi:uracil-DNA glycosylase
MVTDRSNSYDSTPFNFEVLFKNMKPGWKTIWTDVYNQNTELFQTLENKLNEDTLIYQTKLLIFPAKKHIFETFNHFDLNDTKVVILGQDPYHSLGQAHGLSFSVQDGVKHPPSLLNIFKELENEYSDFKIPESGNLTKWLDQGVLLLNSALTVLETCPNQYQKYWSPITDLIVQKMSEQHPGGIVFLLWGAPAQSKAPNQKKNTKNPKKEVINQAKHHILKAVHPSPLSAHRGFFGCDHFKKTNELLHKDGKKIINWVL